MTQQYGLQLKTSRTVTANGQQFKVYEATPTFDFWNAFNDNDKEKQKEKRKALFEKGYSCTKNKEGKWKAQLWRAIPTTGQGITTPATEQAKLAAYN